MSATAARRFLKACRLCLGAPCQIVRCGGDFLSARADRGGADAKLRDDLLENVDRCVEVILELGIGFRQISFDAERQVLAGKLFDGEANCLAHQLALAVDRFGLDPPLLLLSPHAFLRLHAPFGPRLPFLVTELGYRARHGADFIGAVQAPWLKIKRAAGQLADVGCNSAERTDDLRTDDEQRGGADG